MNDNSNNPQDSSPPAALPHNGEADMRPKVNPYPVTTNGLGRPVFPQLYGFAGLTATGPWTFHEHRLFEQSCIMYGWGNWKKIREAIPGRTSDQCKSHGQKFLKHHPHEKDRLIAEHRKLLTARREGANGPPAAPRARRASAKRPVPPTRANGASKTRAKAPDGSAGAPVSAKKEPPPDREAIKRGNCHRKFGVDSIDTICNDIYKRKLKSGCKKFPLCLCEKTPCAREGLTYYFHVGVQPVHSTAASAS